MHARSYQGLLRSGSNRCFRRDLGRNSIRSDKSLEASKSRVCHTGTIYLLPEPSGQHVSLISGLKQ